MERRSVFVCFTIAFAMLIQGSRPQYDEDSDETTTVATISVPNINAFTIKKNQLECLEETKVEPELVLILKTGKWQSYPDKLLKEWILCTLVKAGFMTPQGVFIFDHAIMRLSDEDQDATGAIIDACLSKKAKPPEDIAYEFAKCYHKAKGNKMIITYM